MSDADWAEFQARYQESAAYHEAGHITTAVILKMPLRERGIHVDLNGSGISYYWHRTPGDLGNTAQDRFERNVTITSIYAGWVAQKTFCPECPEHDWFADRREVASLLDEMYSTDASQRITAEAELWEKAQKLVVENWSLIESLAKTLLAKGTTQQSPNEIEKNWSHGQTTCEKCMSGAEIVAFFERLGISSLVRGDSEGTYYPLLSD